MLLVPVTSLRTKQPIARGKHDRLAARRRVALSRVVAVALVVTTVASCLMLTRSGLTELAFGRMSAALMGFLWFCATFTQARMFFTLVSLFLLYINVLLHDAYRCAERRFLVMHHNRKKLWRCSFESSRRMSNHYFIWRMSCTACGHCSHGASHRRIGERAAA